VHPKGKAHNDFHPGGDPTQLETGIQLDMLNTNLHTLRKDPLGIGRYGRQVSDIYTQRDCSEGCVFFDGLGPHDESIPKFRFSIHDGGKMFSWIKSDAKKPSLLSLPSWIKAEIFRSVNLLWNHYSSSENIVAVSWNLEKKTVSGSSPVVGAICREFRSNHASEFWVNNHHLFKMSTTTLRADFDHFRKLEHFWGTYSHRMRYVWYDPGYFHVENSNIRARFLLSFDVDLGATLESIRVNITSLLRITAYIKESATITIVITGPEGNKSPQTIIRLEECRETALASLSEVSEKFDKFSEFYQDQDYPAVWMNGHFEVVEVDLNDVSRDPEDT
jgi:hypothetical protein